jgi:hypothetical protein
VAVTANMLCRLGHESGSRRRFSTMIEFYSHTPQELIDLTFLMARDDIFAGEAAEVRRPHSTPNWASASRHSAPVTATHWRPGTARSTRESASASSTVPPKPSNA